MSEDAAWAWAYLAGLALAIGGSIAGISAWILIPAYAAVMVTLLWWSDRGSTPEQTPEPTPPPKPAPEPVRDEPPWMKHGWDDDLAGLLGDDGRW